MKASVFFKIINWIKNSYLIACGTVFSVFDNVANIFKIIVFASLFFSSPAVVLGQLRVMSNGDTHASRNIFIGNSSNYIGTSSNVPVFFRVNNVLSGSTGSYTNRNVSLGFGALSNVTVSGGDNTAVGFQALFNNTTGTCNSAFGQVALYNNTTGHGNTALSYWSLHHNSTGSDNVGIGYYSLYSNVIGSVNTAIGYFAGGPNQDLSNTTSLGHQSYCTASNQVRLGNSSITSIGGFTGWSNVSDGRAKKNVRSEIPGLAFINLLQPVTYNLDLDAIDEIQKSDDPAVKNLIDSLYASRSQEEKQMLAEARTKKENQVYSGFIAQDVEKAAQSIGYNFSGVDAPENDKTAYGLRYAEFVVPLVKAVQELSEQNNRLQEQINELNAKLNELIGAPKSWSVETFNDDELAKNFSFSLFPNPASGFVTVDYTMFVDAPVSIGLYNMFGQMVKLIVPQQNQKAGTYSVQISVGDLGAGTYILNVSSGNQSEAKQLVINR